MATYAIVTVPAAHKAAFEAAAGEVYSDAVGAPWAASATPAGPITHWIMGDEMTEERLNFYQFPEIHPFTPAGGYPVNGFSEQEVTDARDAAEVFAITRAAFSAPDYQECRDMVTEMLGIVPYVPDY